MRRPRPAPVASRIASSRCRRRRACEQEGGDVRARDQQHDGDETHEQVERRDVRGAQAREAVRGGHELGRGWRVADLGRGCGGHDVWPHGVEPRVGLREGLIGR